MHMQMRPNSLCTSHVAVSLVSRRLASQDIHKLNTVEESMNN